MGNNKIVFSSIKTTKNIKNKDLEVDADGYYTINLGALNTFNSAGAFYKLDGARQLFESSSILMRRIKNGFLKAEVGHPKKQPSMTMNDYMTRILTINPENVCAHIKEIWLEETNEKEPGSNENLVLIKGKVKPNGPKAEFLKELLEDSDANVAFSIRSLTKDVIINGVVVKTLSQVVTWDFVIEPGIKHATKYKTLSIESLDLLSIDLDDNQTKNEISESLKEDENVATEDSREMLQSVIDLFDCKKDNSCILHNW